MEDAWMFVQSVCWQQRQMLQWSLAVPGFRSLLLQSCYLQQHTAQQAVLLWVVQSVVTSPTDKATVAAASTQAFSEIWQGGASMEPQKLHVQYDLVQTLRKLPADMTDKCEVAHLQRLLKQGQQQLKTEMAADSPTKQKQEGEVSALEEKKRLLSTHLMSELKQLLEAPGKAD